MTDLVRTPTLDIGSTGMGRSGANRSFEAALTQNPAITVPTVASWGADDGVASAGRPDVYAAHFAGYYQFKVLPGVGHDIPREASASTLEALWSVAVGSLTALPACAISAHSLAA